MFIAENMFIAYVQSKLENIGVGLELERTMLGDKLEKNSFNNIFAMKISVVFEFNNTNSSSADIKTWAPSDFIKNSK